MGEAHQAASTAPSGDPGARPPERYRGPRRRWVKPIKQHQPPRPSALVEEAPLRDAGLVLGCHLDISRGQQEHLVGHSFNAPAKPEDQSRREVDQTLCVTIDHLGEIHDHRSALTEMLSDRTRFIVRTRMKCGDPGEVGGLWYRSGTALHTRVCHVLAYLTVRLVDLGLIFGLQAVIVIGIFVILLIGAVLVLVAVVILHEAEVDRHLAHRAGHLASSVAPVFRPAVDQAPRRYACLTVWFRQAGTATAPRPDTGLTRRTLPD